MTNKENCDIITVYINLCVNEFMKFQKMEKIKF